MTFSLWKVWLRPDLASELMEGWFKIKFSMIDYSFYLIKFSHCRKILNNTNIKMQWIKTRDLYVYCCISSYRRCV
jgi:hypothetical protein